ncbi:hypothetical protein GOP47_0030741 [Adiantum capillus-veneris]|nr:hypothetical protein GOP47_0030741 [Adiantum capillus-veneris]
MGCGWVPIFSPYSLWPSVAHRRDFYQTQSREARADEESWEGLIRSGLVYGGGQIELEELFKVMKKRVERVDMRTESGSYQQRVVLEYLKEIEERAQAVIEAFQTSRT